jgi:dTDP-4-dehydrorhamnose reductase
MRNVLVLGYGALGSEIVEQTGWDYISRKKDGFDFNDSDSYNRFIIGYDTIVNCIAHTDTYTKDKDPNWNCNYKSVYNLALHCNKIGAKLVHISTDFVYAGNSKQEPSEEDVPVHAENWYSYTKLLGDSVVEMLSNNYLICRCSHKPYPYPWPVAFTDRISNADYTPVIAALIVDLIDKNAFGIVNTGTERKSMYDLAKEQPGVMPGLTPDGYPKDSSMSIEKQNKFLNIGKI